VCPHTLLTKYLLVCHWKSWSLVIFNRKRY